MCTFDHFPSLCQEHECIAVNPNNIWTYFLSSSDRLLCVAQKLLQLLSPNTAHLTRTDAECQGRHSEMVAANVNLPNAPCCMSCLVDNPWRTQVHCAASRGS